MIAKAGKPLVKVLALESPSPHEVRRLGFMSAQMKVPDDYDRMRDSEISSLFRTKS